MAKAGNLKLDFMAKSTGIAVITVAPAVKYSFVSRGMQTRRTGQHKAKLTLSPRLHVKPLITVITAIHLFEFADIFRCLIDNENLKKTFWPYVHFKMFFSLIGGRNLFSTIILCRAAA